MDGYTECYEDFGSSNGRGTADAVWLAYCVELLRAFEVNLVLWWSCKSILLRATTESIYFLKIFSLFIFRERGREGERKGEKHWCERYLDWLPLARPQLGTWRTTQACALTGMGNLSI